jgi:hypothetical protein
VKTVLKGNTGTYFVAQKITILLGAPVTGDSRIWQSFGQVVAGKIINGYSK